MNRIMSTTVKEQLDLLGLTPNDLLVRMNNLVHRLVEEEAKLYSSKENLQKEYIQTKMNSKGIKISRATIYNILNNQHALTSDTAILVRTVINEARKTRSIKPDLSYDDMNIKVYKGK